MQTVRQPTLLSYILQILKTFFLFRRPKNPLLDGKGTILLKTRRHCRKLYEKEVEMPRQLVNNQTSCYTRFWCFLLAPVLVLMTMKRVWKVLPILLTIYATSVKDFDNIHFMNIAIIFFFHLSLIVIKRWHLALHHWGIGDVDDNDEGITVTTTTI